MTATSSAPRPLRIALIGFSSRSDNLGVGALTVSQIEILRDIARDLGRPLEIAIVDPKGPRGSYIAGPNIRIVDFDRNLMLSPRGFFALARRSDLVIDIGAGDSFADIYGSGRLKRMFVLKFLTHLAGTPLVLAPQTIGPFTKGWSKRLALASIRRCALVATRDTLSTQALRDLGYAGAVVEASDVALRLPYEAPAPRTGAGSEGGPLRVGLNVSGLLMHGGYTGKNEFGISLDYPGLIRDLIRFFQGEGAEVHLVPHVFPADPGKTHREDDTVANHALSTEFPGVVEAPRFSSPSEAKSYIAGLDFFMGARMHACIAAFSSGVPVVPMAYSRKFKGLFGSLGYDWTVDCTAEGKDAILAKIAGAYRSRAHLAEDLAKARRVGEANLGIYQDAILRSMTAV